MTQSWLKTGVVQTFLTSLSQTRWIYVCLRVQKAKVALAAKCHQHAAGFAKTLCSTILRDLSLKLSVQFTIRRLQETKQQSSMVRHLAVGHLLSFFISWFTLDVSYKDFCI